MKSITVNGVQYRSIVEAWRACAPPTLKLITVRLRLRNGWHPDDAFAYGTVDPVDRSGFKRARQTAMMGRMRIVRRRVY